MHDLRSGRKRFSELHAAGTFVIPNAWDIGSARILESLGFAAITTTSSGHAASLGRMDQQASLDEFLDHAEALVRDVDVRVGGAFCRRPSRSLRRAVSQRRPRTERPSPMRAPCTQGEPTIP